MNEYEIAAVACVVIFGLWVLAYILCWIGQRVWAWVDDSEADKEILISKKFNFSKWKYPIYLYGQSKIFAYAKDKKNDGKNTSGLDHGVDYIYPFEMGFGSFWSIALITSISPFVSVFLFEIYPFTLSVGIIAVIAYLARFSRRHKKLFDMHLTDKEAHK